MTTTYKIQLSQQPIAEVWGKGQVLAFTAEGASIHLANLTDDAANMEKIQKAARQIANLKLPAIELAGTWSLEAQWHLWQGLYSPKGISKIHWAELSSEDKHQLDSRVKVFGWVRDLINQTPEDLSPMKLATLTGDFISQLASDSVSVKLISDKELEEQGYVGIHGVGRGSVRPPVLLELDFCPPGKSEQPPAAALVGKGITFDSGGYSMKSSMGMLHMKCDMGGAATVAGALALAILNGLNQRVKLYLCCAENLVSGHAYKLADILTYRNGISVEVVNTDAEGRLVLADGLIDASASGAPLIIDAATLTGAAMVAVGDSYNALFSLNDELATQFDAVAKAEYDPSWRLPLTLTHQNNCPSPFADTANSKPMPGGGAGGASNAAGFLSRFVTNPEKSWLHVDLAACYQNAAGELWSAGATGRGVRSIAAFLNKLDT